MNMMRSIRDDTEEVERKLVAILTIMPFEETLPVWTEQFTRVQFKPVGHRARCEVLADHSFEFPRCLYPAFVPYRDPTENEDRLFSWLNISPSTASLIQVKEMHFGIQYLKK